MTALTGSLCRLQVTAPRCNDGTDGYLPLCAACPVTDCEDVEPNDSLLLSCVCFGLRAAMSL